MPGSVPSSRTQANHRLIEWMRVLHQQTRAAYGARKMWQLLTREGLVCGRPRVVRLRLMAGSMALRRRRYICIVQVRQHETPGHSESPQPTVCRIGKGSCVS